VETARHSGQKRVLSISVTTATRLRVTVAQTRAELSVDTTAPVARQLQDTPAVQHAETSVALETRHVTTATPSVGMDAVRAALSNLDGDAHPSHAFNLFAIQFVETGLSMEVNNATVLLGAAQHARPSADSPALAMHVHQHAETVRSLATRHATTATFLVGMDAVRAAL
jgi:hypothetical protein